jgi:hypothetical protein
VLDYGAVDDEFVGRRLVVAVGFGKGFKDAFLEEVRELLRRGGAEGGQGHKMEMHEGESENKYNEPTYASIVK